MRISKFLYCIKIIYLFLILPFFPSSSYIIYLSIYLSIFIYTIYCAFYQFLVFSFRLFLLKNVLCLIQFLFISFEIFLFLVILFVCLFIIILIKQPLFNIIHFICFAFFVFHIYSSSVSVVYRRSKIYNQII